MSEQAKTGDLNRYWEKLAILTGSPIEVAKVLRLGVEVGYPICLVGEAGIGKTQLCAQVAEDLKRDVVYYYLAHLEREDIGGIPMPTEDKKSYRFLCEQSIQELIESDRPTIMVLDEWNRGEKPVMNSAFTLMEQRRFGSYVLPPHIYICAAMNPSEGAYLVNEAEKDPAFRRRLCFVGMRCDPASWLHYATGRGKFHHLVTEHIAAQPQLLLDVESREAGKVYANPAAWEKVSNIYHHMEKTGMNIVENLHTLRLLLAGYLGSGTTEVHLGWVQNHAMAISPIDVLRHYRSKAQDKVRQLVAQNNAAVIGELLESVTLTLVSQEMSAAEVADNIGEFSQDLNEDQAMTLFNKINKHLSASGRAEYKLALSKGLAKNEKYSEAVRRTQRSLKRVQDEITS